MITEAQRIQLADGLHFGIPAEEYHAIDACSNSSLSIIHNQSPRHLRYRLDNRDTEKTPALVLGEAAHSCILEPDDFASHYVAAPVCDKRTNVGKDIWSRFCAENIGKKILTADQHQTADAIRSAVWSHPAARELLQRGIDREVSCFFEIDGLECKARFDAPAFTVNAIVDVKTTEDASPDAFTRSIFNYGYHRQGSFYLRGAAACGQVVEHFVIIAVEKCPPFGVGVYRLTDEALEAGETQLAPLIATFAKCQRSGEWPGYGNEVRDIGIPDWAMKKIDNI